MYLLVESDMTSYQVDAITDDEKKKMLYDNLHIYRWNYEENCFMELFPDGEEMEVVRA